MSTDESADGGLTTSLRRLASSLLALLQRRVELFALELQEQKLRTLGLLLWIAIALALSVAAILLALGTLALFLWHAAGYAGLVGLTLVLAGASVAVFLLLRRKILRGPAPFAATAAEFRKDLACLQRR